MCAPPASCKSTGSTPFGLKCHSLLSHSTPLSITLGYLFSPWRVGSVCSHLHSPVIAFLPRGGLLVPSCKGPEGEVQRPAGPTLCAALHTAHGKGVGAQVIKTCYFTQLAGGGGGGGGGGTGDQNLVLQITSNLPPCFHRGTWHHTKRWTGTQSRQHWALDHRGIPPHTLWHRWWGN